MKRFSVALLAVLLLFGCAHQGLEQTGAWTPAGPAAGIQARYLDDAVRTNNAAIDAVFGTMLTAGTAVTSTAAELNILDGVTSSAAELNILDGVTSSAAELNILDGVTSSAAELNILDGVTSSTAELNKLDGVTATTAELNESSVGAAHTSFSAGGDLTGTVYIAKVGKVVTMTWGALSHSSSYEPASGVGVVPAAYRPVATAVAVYTMLSTSLQRVGVSTAGTINFYYRDWAGLNDSSTQASPGTISWVIP